jgi:hypothetical protein
MSKKMVYQISEKVFGHLENILECFQILENIFGHLENILGHFQILLGRFFQMTPAIVEAAQGQGSGGAVTG